MSNKTLIILALIFGVVCLVTVGAYLMDKNQGIFEKKINIGVDWDKVGEGVSRVKIDKGERSVELTSQADQWRVGQYRADQGEVDRLKQGIKKIVVDALVSEAKDKWSKYGVSDDQKIKVSLTAEGKNYVLGVGEAAVGGSFYLTIGDEAKVYLVKGVDRSLFDLTLNEWRDKTMINLGRDQIGSVKIASRLGSMNLAKNDQGKWELEYGGRRQLLGDDTSNRLLATLGPLLAIGFVSDADKKTFVMSGDKTRVIIVMEDGKVETLNLLERDTEWWGQLDGGEDVYRLSKVVVSSVVLDPKGIFK